VEPSLILDEMLRSQAPDIERAYGEVMLWWENSRPRRAHSVKFWNSHATDQNHMGLWCDVPGLIRSLSLEDATAPVAFGSPRYKRIYKMAWRVRVAVNADTVSLWLGQRVWQERVQTPMAVYRVLLRKLQRWVMSKEGWTEEQFVRSATFHSNRIDNYRPAMLALLCLRSQFEDRMWEGHQWNPRTAQLRDEPVLDIAHCHRRTPRLAWRAAFLALYVSWYARILRSNHLTVDSLAFYERGEKSHLLIWSELRDEQSENFWGGEIVFPWFDALEGLLKGVDKRDHLRPSGRADAESVGKAKFGAELGAVSGDVALTGSVDHARFDDSIKAFLDWLGQPRETSQPPDLSINSRPRGTAATIRTYQFDLERFACWCSVQFKTRPSDMDPQKCARYVEFLAEPTPREYWMSEAGRATFGEQWHRFKGPLSTNSIRRAALTVNAYYRFLQQSGRISQILQIDTPHC